MKSGAFRNKLRQELETAGVENSGQESLWFCAAAAGLSPAEFSVSEREMQQNEITMAESYVQRRCKGEPLQYILGNEYFGDLEFLVGPGVLIPRPETYFMVEFAVGLLPNGGRFCELGTGSGAVALSVASLRPDVSVYASEISPDAIQWALKNREKLELPQADIRLGSFFEPFPADMKFHCVAANLPYIPEWELPNLQREVRDFEPGRALFAGDSGMADIKNALILLQERLLPGGNAVFEGGSEQMEPLRDFAKAYFPRVAIADDLFQKPRFLIIQN
ncbi:MAG: peptide chain release factor N(5)-glutamine methyltransferase [Lentisphaeria bacterium]|nr:peptide chain release factor N(5)-glutamine methyltransferase [Lentisphaeria bacterium]